MDPGPAAAHSPFPAHWHRLPDGNVMHYVDEGPPNAPTLLFVHGNPTWSFLFRRAISHFRDRFRCIAPDLIGFGLSSKPADWRYYTLARHIEHLTSLLQSLEITWVVPVVHDWGGPVALGWATRNPNRVSGVVLTNTWAFASTQPRLPRMLKLLVGPGMGELVTSRLNLWVNVALRGGSKRRLPQDVVEAYEAPFPTPESRSGVLAFPRMIPLVSHHPSWGIFKEIEEALPRLEVPALIVYGRHDPVIRPRMAHTFQRLLPSAEEPILLDDASHYVWEDAPEELLGAMRDFLDRHKLG